MNKRKLLTVVLAAGMGTRMKSDLPKPLHKVGGEAMVTHVIRAAQSLNPDRILVVIGPGMEAVAGTVAPHDTVVQNDRLGTGHAVKVALEGQDLDETDVLVLYGDVPLVSGEALATLVARHWSDDAPVVTILGMAPDDPTGYGRLILDTKDYVTAVVEELDATPAQRQVKLCSSGIMVLRGEKLADALAKIKNDNAKKEYYLLDVLPIMRGHDDVAAYTLGSSDDLNGINDREQLAAAEARMQQRLRAAAMRGGVTMIDPSTVYLSADTRFGQDIIIEPNVVIGPGVVVENNVTIKASCYIASVRLQQGAKIGPFVHIRDHSDIGRDAVVVNFVELKKSVLAQHAKISPFSCVVDADIGAYANVGAGTIISNWNGVEKFRTQVGDYAFVGGNSTLVSPVCINEAAFVSAGSTITEDVASGEMAFGRARQVNRPVTKTANLYAQKQKNKVKK